MKLFSLILVLIVLALNLVPCADVQEEADQQTAAAGKQASAVNRQVPAASQHPDTGHPHPFNDSCSPFCHCSCCANSSVTQLLQLSSVPSTDYKNAAIPYLTGNYIDVSLPVWQPPQWS